MQAQWPAAVAYPPRPFALHNLLAGWPQDEIEHEDLTNKVCLRETHQCPGQSCFFGDPGSLVDFFAPDMVDHAVMAHWAYPPYGLSVVWRMDDTDCDLGCGDGGYLLRDAQSDLYVLGQPLSYGPFTTGVTGGVVVGPSEHASVSCCTSPASRADDLFLDVCGSLCWTISGSRRGAYCGGRRDNGCF